MCKCCWRFVHYSINNYSVIIFRINYCNWHNTNFWHNC